jgi:hypothetical protein
VEDQLITLENSRVRAVIAPEFGGRVWEFRDLTRDRQWIWRRPGTPLRVATETDRYDEIWAGGWEELFPNDAAGYFEGRRLTDHGEWWRLQWMIDQMQQGANPSLTLSATTSTPACRCIKHFALQSSPPGLRVSYRIESHESASFHFLFKLHLAVAIESGCTLRLPGGTVTAVDPSFGSLLPGRGPFDWSSPEVEPVRSIPHARSDAREFVYITNLPEGWCGIDDPATRASLRLHFDSAVLPYAWLFLSYGGWRDCYTAVLEPCTNMPKDLNEATRAGRSAALEPGGVFETEVTAVLGGIPA